MKKILVLISASLLSALSWAQPALRAAPPDLPANDLASQLIDSDPTVVQARHSLDASRQRARALYVGPHEWTARATTQRRRERATGIDSNEWSVGLERAIRVGGKAAIDREMGDAHVRLAQARLGEARHETAVGLLGQWLSWSTATRIRMLWHEQLQFAQDNLMVAGKRRKAGDASVIEENAARADVAEVQRQLSAAQTDEAKAHARLKARFPALALEPMRAAEPEGLEGEPTRWRERILEESDVLRVAREEVKLAELQAARARADRIADPTVGVFSNSDRSGAERVVGLSFSMPIGGSARHAQERERAQQAEAARAAAQGVQRALEAEIAQALADATGGLERWRLAMQSLELARDNARLTRRAYSLGEVDIQAVLLARRQDVDAALGIEQARLAAHGARYRLFVDAHLIWGLQED